MWDSFIRELKDQIRTVRETIVTREFWIYFGVIVVLLAVAGGGAYLAIGFDTLSRQKMASLLACKTGDMQLLVIIVGGFIFMLLSLFALGEVTAWVEEKRQAKTAQWKSVASIWRPIIFFGGAMTLGIGGAALMAVWCM